jgi:CHRD domain
MRQQWVRLALLNLVFVGMASGAAWAQSSEMTAKLTGGDEAPNTVNSGAFGTATIKVDQGSGDITYTIRVWNLPTGVIAAHFHVGAEKTPGPVIINIAVPTNVSNDFTMTGTVNVADFVARPDQGIRSENDALQAILGENTYINVHSQANPGGEIRGQVKHDPR